MIACESQPYTIKVLIGGHPIRRTDFVPFSGQIKYSRPLLIPEVEISTNESEIICEAHEAAIDDTDKDAKTLISEYRIKNNNKVVLATLNINSLKNKFTS